MKAFITFAVIGILALVGIMSVGSINRAERAQGYPFGKMCNSIFTGYVNTCPK